MGVLDKELLSTDTVFAYSTLCKVTTSVVMHVKEKEEKKTSSSMQLASVCRVQEVTSRQKVFSLEKRLEKHVFTHKKTCSWTINHICKARSAYVNENLDQCVKHKMCVCVDVHVSLPL